MYRVVLCCIHRCVWIAEWVSKWVYIYIYIFAWWAFHSGAFAASAYYTIQCICCDALVLVHRIHCWYFFYVIAISVCRVYCGGAPWLLFGIYIYRMQESKCSFSPPRSLYIYRQRYCQCEIMENCEWRIANARKVSMEYDVGRLVKAICTWTYIEAIQIIKLATITWDISKSSEREHRFSSAQQYHYGI